jgi:hypothetical protein
MRLLVPGNVCRVLNVGGTCERARFMGSLAMIGMLLGRRASLRRRLLEVGLVFAVVVATVFCASFVSWRADAADRAASAQTESRQRPVDLEWDYLPSNVSFSGDVFVARVPGGWFVTVKWSSGDSFAGGGFFYPDPEHKWDGKSLPR